MRLKALFILVSLSTSEWSIPWISASRGPYKNDPKPLTWSYSFRDEDIFTLYTFDKDLSEPKELVKTISEQNYIAFIKIARMRRSLPSLGFLQNIYSIEKPILRNLPKDFLLLSVIRQSNVPGTAYIDVSSVGGTDYAVFEKFDDNRLEMAQPPLLNWITFPSQTAGGLFEPDRSLIEMRFQLRTKTYIVLGCEKFWSVMSAEKLLPFLSTKDKPRAIIKAYMTVACTAYLLKSSETPLTEAAAQLACARTKVRKLNALISSILVVMTERVRPPSSNISEEKSKTSQSSSSSENENNRSSESGTNRSNTQKRMRVRSITSPSRVHVINEKK